jgi:hypothetical protein
MAPDESKMSRSLRQSFNYIKMQGFDNYQPRHTSPTMKKELDTTGTYYRKESMKDTTGTYYRKEYMNSSDNERRIIHKLYCIIVNIQK